MVTLLYILIIVPIVAYLVFTAIEIGLVFRIAVLNHSRSLLFIQASTEITHTLLVFSYAQFMVTFSALLVQIGAQLYWPLALLIVTLLGRGSLYLLLFYRERPARWAYLTLFVTYLLGVSAVLWALMIVVKGVVTTHFIPYTDDMPLVLSVGIPALIIFFVPIIAVYAHALTRLKGRS